MGEAHATISADFLNRIAHGDMTWKPTVKSLEGGQVRFEDGTAEEIDIIVWCTGYKVRTAALLRRGLHLGPRHDLPLFRRVFKPGIDNLFFIALLQPLGATMPLAEGQGPLDRLVSARRVPPAAECAAAGRDMNTKREKKMFKRYVASKRHTMQVDFDNYLYDLGKELKAGTARARAVGFRLPVQPRAPQRRSRPGAVSLAPSSRQAGTDEKANDRAAIIVAAREVFAELFGYDAAGCAM